MTPIVVAVVEVGGGGRAARMWTAILQRGSDARLGMAAASMD